MKDIEMEKRTEERERMFYESLKEGVYLPSFMFRGDEICFFMWELTGKTHEEAMEKLDIFKWTPEQSRLFLLVVSLDIVPTGKTYLFGGDNPKPFTWYEGKIDAFRCAFVGGKSWERLQKEQNHEDKGIHASD